MKKFMAMFLCATLAMGTLAGCSSNTDNGSSTADGSSAAANDAAISVVTREDGSGTRVPSPSSLRSRTLMATTLSP